MDVKMIKTRNEIKKKTLSKKRAGKIDKLLTKVLCYKNDKRLYKSFGVQSWGGEIGKRTGLISQRPDQGLAGSSFPNGNPVPSAQKKK